MKRKKLTAAEKEERSEQRYQLNRVERDAVRKSALVVAIAELNRAAKISAFARARRAAIRVGEPDGAKRKKYRLQRLRKLMDEHREWMANAPALRWENDFAGGDRWP